MLSKLSIPDKINVGFQNRADTYTGKLAYVVYTDKKGVLRKEASWEGWRDKKIEPKEFENKPTSGFVLNKKVGDYHGGWHGRRAAIRIYDPRDFEFEIKLDNLLFILEETSAIKGKGLEGEFVYSWDGADLVLLPANSQEYKSSVEFTELQTKKVGKEDMKEGCLYLNKDKQQVMYLGRQDWYELTSEYRNNYGRHKYMQQSKQHVFVSVDGKSTYWTQTGFTKLATRLSEEPSPLFADEFEKFKKSINGSEPVDLVGTPYKFNASQSYWSHNCYLKTGKDYYFVRFDTDYRGGYRLHKSSNPVMFTVDKKVIIDEDQNRGYYNNSLPSLTKDEIEAMSLFTLSLKNKQGTLIPL